MALAAEATPRPTSGATGPTAAVTTRPMRATPSTGTARTVSQVMVAPEGRGTSVAASTPGG